jgi:alpha-galactosidase
LNERRNTSRLFTLGVFCGALALLIAAVARAQSGPAVVHFDAGTQVFRIDAAQSTYVLGINENGQVQTLYWGKRLAASDHFAQADAMQGASSFDLPLTTTPQEFVGWGGSLFVEPDLKITFPDGNRDLVLKYVSHRIEGDKLSIVMKDISREVYVTLDYQADSETGILRRSARIENRTDAPFTIEQVAAATWNLPRGTDYRLRYLTGRWAAARRFSRAVAAPPVPKTIRGLRLTTTPPAIRTKAACGLGHWAGADRGRSRSSKTHCSRYV